MDDLNTPLAVAVIAKIEKEYKDGPGLPIEIDQFISAANLLGILQKDPEEWFRGKSKEGGLTDAQIDDLIAERADVRAAKNWARADEIRDIFAAENIILEDSKASTTWRRG